MREKEKHWFFVPLIYAFIDCFLHVPWLGSEPVTVAYQGGILTEPPGRGVESSSYAYFPAPLTFWPLGQPYLLISDFAAQ